MLRTLLFSTVALCTILDISQGAKVNLAGTLVCDKDPKVLCQLSNAAIVTLNKTPYVMSSSDKNSTRLYFYDLKHFEKPSASFAERILPDRVIDIPADQGKKPLIEKVESIATVDDWIILVGVYADRINSKIIGFKLDAQEHPILIQELAGPTMQKDLTKTLLKFDDVDDPESHYIKIEASVAVPSGDGKQKLLIGVRTQGTENNVNEKDVVRILSNDITVTKDKLTLGPKWKALLDMKQNPGYGISDLAFDPHAKTVQMTTSLEKDGKLNGALWSIPLASLLKGKDEFVRLDGVNFETHKPEGLTIFPKGNNHLSLVICDEDRTTPTLANGRARTTDESPFFVVDTKAKAK